MASTAESNNRRARVRKPNSKYLGGDYVNSDFENVTTLKAQTSPKPSGTTENLSQARPKWRQQWRRVPQNEGNAVVSPVSPTMASMQPNTTKPQTASKTASKRTPQTASKAKPKGQLTSQCPFHFMISTKIPTKFL